MARAARRSRRTEPRRVAYDLLRAVGERGAYANLALPGLLAQRGLTGRDAALATELSYGTLRAQGTLDAVLAACLRRPLAEVDVPLLDALRLGAYQLLRTRIPAHAAVAVTVDLARSACGPRVAGLTNAVLRRVAGRNWAGWVDELAVDPLHRLALAYAHPRWVVAAFRDALGGSLTETEAALAADDARPQVHLAARPGRISRAALVEESGGMPGPWSPYAVRLSEGDPGRLPAVQDGRAGVQDEGSQLAALALARAPVDGRDERWLDLCAGPGGKAALLAGLAAERGARLLAADRSPTRSRLVAGAVAGGPVLVIAADTTRPAWRPGVGDRVLLDAPCSGLGALRRRPELRWRRRPGDLPELVRLQRTLLTGALDAVRIGGLVAYVTCSPHQAETTELVGSVLAGEDDVEAIDARPLLVGVPELGAGPTVQLWPHRHGTDAMFVALLRRR